MFYLVFFTERFPFGTVHIIFSVIQPWSIISEYLLGLMSIFSTKKVLQFQACLEEGFFQLTNKSTGSLVFHGLHTPARKLSWSTSFRRIERIFVSVASFLGKLLFPGGQIRFTMCALTVCLYLVYKNTILWSSHDKLPWRVTGMLQKL